MTRRDIWLRMLAGSELQYAYLLRQGVSFSRGLALGDLGEQMRLRHGWRFRDISRSLGYRPGARRMPSLLATSPLDTRVTLDMFSRTFRKLTDYGLMPAYGVKRLRPASRTLVYTDAGHLPPMMAATLAGALKRRQS